jgi:membrane protein DedA with SNARE-associated domain
MDTWLSQLVANYGYLAVFGGALLEGESILILAAYAAQRGYLSFPAVICVAFVGATLGDQFFFLIGRRFGDALLQRWPRLRARTERVKRLLLRYPGSITIAVRFAYGLRIAGPIAIGMSELPAKRFFIFNAIGALIWAPLVAGVGFLFGHALERLLGDLRQYEMIGLIVLTVLILVGGIVSHALKRRRT